MFEIAYYGNSLFIIYLIKNRVLQILYLGCLIQYIGSRLLFYFFLDLTVAFQIKNWLTESSSLIAA